MSTHKEDIFICMTVSQSHKIHSLLFFLIVKEYLISLLNKKSLIRTQAIHSNFSTQLTVPASTSGFLMMNIFGVYIRRLAGNSSCIQWIINIENKLTAFIWRCYICCFMSYFVCSITIINEKSVELQLNGFLVNITHFCDFLFCHLFSCRLLCSQIC